MFLAFLTTLSTDQRCRVVDWILKNWKRDLAETSLGLILDTIPKLFIRVYTKHEKTSVTYPVSGSRILNPWPAEYDIGKNKHKHLFCGATVKLVPSPSHCSAFYEGWNFNSGNYLFTTDTK